MQKITRLFLIIFSCLFLVGCNSYNPVVVFFPFSVSSINGKSITEIISTNSKSSFIWDQLDRKNNVFEENIEVRVVSTSDKVVFQFSRPSALADFNDSWVNIDPKLVHVTIGSQVFDGAKVFDGNNNFSYEVKRGNENQVDIVVTLDYDKLFKTRKNVRVVWLGEKR